jgi:hypothetical protein
MVKGKKYTTLKVKEKEVRLMAKPIASTPILKGRDLYQLIKDVQKPDRGKEKRKLARKLLHQASGGKY